MKLERQLSTPNFWKSEMERDGKALWGSTGWRKSVNNHLFLNTLSIAALQNNKQTNHPNTNRPKKLFFCMHTLITSISPVLLLFELSVIPDTEQVLTYESYHYFITRTQNGTIDKGYSKRAIYYISIAIFFFLFMY